jgi:Fe-S cluster assembly protein SufB
MFLVMEYAYKMKEGLDENVVKEISAIKKEPQWMLERRLSAYNVFKEKEVPRWAAPFLSQLNLDEISYYAALTEKKEADWNAVPEEIKATFEKLGIPEAERKFLAGSVAQFESEVAYRHLKKEWESKGVIFTDMDSAVREYGDIVKKYMGSVVPIGDNKFSTLNDAVWSGGSFVYVPRNVVVGIPLQAYFRINTQNIGQFERTLIIAEEGSSVSYIEGCSAPIYSAASLHAAVVEVIAKKNSHVRYTTVQNWSTNVYNLVTKRAFAYENATVEWIDGNIGSAVTMKYPSIFLKERGARADILSIAYAGKNQIQDTGARAIHLAEGTSSKILSRSISKDGGRALFRGLVKIEKGAINSKAHMRCDALMLDDKSYSQSYPALDVNEMNVNVAHEATVGKISENKLFYIMSRGISEEDAIKMIVLGFIEPFTKELPLEYAVELNRLIQLQL